jgi:hypothetical protein
MRYRLLLLPVLVLATAAHAAAQTSLRVMPPPGASFAAGQRFDLRVEAAGTGSAPTGLVVTLDGRDITTTNVLAAGAAGERGHGGTGTPDGTAGSPTTRSCTQRILAA